jgi:uncharacterized protein (TIGR03086 family)
MDDVDLLESILTKTARLMAEVGPDERMRPTPCPDYDVRTLVNHMAGWAQVFAAAARGEQFDGDPGTYDGTDPASDFRTAAEAIVSGWREGGLDRQVTLTGGEIPGHLAVSMTLMEFLTHGWDLAVATEQEVPYTEQEAAEVLARAEKTLPPQFRGEGRPFGQIVEVPDGAPSIDRLIGFMGREPVGVRGG